MKYTSNDLVQMLSYPRPARSLMEKEFIVKYISSVPGMKSDSFGNYYKRIGKSDTAFCCHTDTVHHFGGTQRQVVQVSNDGWAFKKDGDVLGADDTTGVWLCLNLIHKKIPGLYIFHRDEEIGGKGSSYIANKTPQLVKGIKKIIAFDRKDYHDVIIQQRNQYTASQEFGLALAKQLGHNFKPARGVFTDSANYSHLIPECANLSIGYFYAHSKDEIQDLTFAEALSTWLSRINWSSLPVKRAPVPPQTYVRRIPKPQQQVDDFWGYQDLNDFWFGGQRR